MAQKTGFAWDAVTTNTDGSAVNGPVVYEVHFGTSSKNYTSKIGNIPSTTEPISAVLSSQPDGLYYVAVDAIDVFGTSSGYSNEVQVLKVGTGFFVQNPAEIPAAPGNLVLT